MQYIQEEDFEEKEDIINISFITNSDYFINILLLKKTKIFFDLSFFFTYI